MGKKAERLSNNKPFSRKTVPDSKGWTHVDSKGQARMVNIGTKKITKRKAIAFGTVRVKAETLKRIKDNSLEKGDVLSVAKVSGILAAKRTFDLIPMCHPIRITGVELSFTPGQDPPRVDIVARVEATDRTGVEMEALTAVAVAALTIYDMCKSVDRGIQITDLGLMEKSGGKSGTYQRKRLSLAIRK